MSEITITIPYWLPSAEGAARFLVWYVIAGSLAYTALFIKTKDNRRFGLAPTVMRYPILTRALALVAAFIALWPVGVILHAVNMRRWKREGRRL